MFRVLLIGGALALAVVVPGLAFSETMPDCTAVYRVAFQQRPVDAAGHRRLAYARWNTQPWGIESSNQVLEDLEAALSLDPRDVSAWRLAATVTIFWGDLTEASRCLGRVIQLAPEDKEAVELNRAIFLTGGPEPGKMTRDKWREIHMKLMDQVVKSRIASQYGGLQRLKALGLLRKGSRGDNLLQALETGPGIRLDTSFLSSRHFVAVAVASGVSDDLARVTIAGAAANRHYVTPAIVGHLRGHAQSLSLNEQIARRTRGMNREEARLAADRYLSRLGFRPGWPEQLHGEHVEMLMNSHQWANRWEQLAKPEDPVRAQEAKAAEKCSTCGGGGTIRVRCPNPHCTRGRIRVRRTDVVGVNPITGQRITQSYPVRVPCPVCGGNHIQTETCPTCHGLGTTPLQVQ